jgi:ABC-type lipoprotein release transport system permease subunit
VSSTLAIAGRNLTRRWHRSALTVAGVALGAGAYFILVTSAHGLRQEVQASIDTAGVDILVQRKGATLPQLSHLSPANLAAVSATEGVLEVSGAVIGITGAGGDLQLVLGIDLARSVPWRTWTVAGTPPRPRSGELAMGSSAASRLEVSPGDSVEIMGRDRFRVASIFRTGHSLLDGAAVVDLPDAQRIFDLGADVNFLFVNVRAGAAVDDVAARVTRSCPGLDALPTRTFVERRFTDLAHVEAFARYLGLVALAIAALGVANTVNMNVAERTQEIGILRAVGWRRRRVAALVLLETSLAATAGALLGGLVAALVLHAMASPSTGPAMGVTWVVPASLSLRTAVEGLTLSLVAGAVGSLGALARALRIKPAQALRSWV